MLKFLSKVFGTKNDRELKKIRPIVAQINAMEDSFKAMSDDELRNMTNRFKEKLEKGATTDEILPAAFGTIREASWRVLGMRHYDVQMIGGIILHRGNIAEMRTGEGKTLVATAPSYLNALTGKGVHVITVNDYLASRDAEWMGRVYNWLGLTSGTILGDMSDQERQDAYNCDITYGTNNEFGFDYLRDNMKYSLDRKVQRPLHYAIIDEVDSILVDEARTPLIISGRANQSTDLYYDINKVVPFLRKDEDYIVDEEHHSVTLTDEGVEHLEKRLEIKNLYEPANIEYLHHVNKALQAHTLYKKDINYIVDDDQVIIVDEHTGRPMEGRRWSDGLHQAVEAKEGVEIRDENQTLATVTFQNFFRMYDKLSGMTGTAETEAEEFKEIYKLECRVIPTNRPIQRLDQNDVIYKTEREKFKAIVEQILTCNAKGQPVLVGTVSVEKSDAISKVLRRKGIKHTVLNAKYHRSEAEIVAQAGRLNAVTIATNMAGRGTDILLGGNPEDLAEKATGTDSGPEYEAALKKFEVQCAEEKKEVLAAGGLFILATERHESRRIDNQLRGRAGRQGDPGESRFFLSLEDDLLRIFNADRIAFIMDRLDMPEGEPIEANMVTKSIENAQKRVEGRNFDIRKNLLEYDDVMNVQRKTIYELRDKVLAGGDPLYDALLDVFDRIAVATVDTYMPEKVRPEDWNRKGFLKECKKVFGLDLDISDLVRRDQIEELLWNSIEELLKNKIEELDYIAQNENERFEDAEDYEPKTGKDIFVELVQNTYLKAIDDRWRDHLKAMDALRDSVRFEGYAQKDPKKVYKIEGYKRFEATMLEIDQRVITYMTKIEVEREDQIKDLAPDAVRIRAVQSPKSAAASSSIPVAPGVSLAPVAASAMPISLEAPEEPSEDEVEEEIEETEPLTEEEMQAAKEAAEAAAQALLVQLKVGRNDPCPCGSGKKFKRCHKGREAELLELLGDDVAEPDEGESETSIDEPETDADA